MRGSGLSSRASVRPVFASTRRMTLLASWTTTRRPSGEKQPAESAIRLASRQVPTSQSRHGKDVRHQPFAVTAKLDRSSGVNGKLGHFREIGDAPDLGPMTGGMCAGCQPLAIRAHGNPAAIVQRPDTDRPLGAGDVGVAKVGLGHDPTGTVNGDPAVPRRQRNRPRGAEAKLAALGVEMNRPPLHARRAAGDQVTRSIEQRVRRVCLDPKTRAPCPGRGPRARRRGLWKRQAIGHHTEPMECNNGWLRVMNGSRCGIPPPDRPGRSSTGRPTKPRFARPR